MEILKSSFKMGIIDGENAKSKDTIKAKCHNCGEINQRVLSEHKRLCKRQHKYCNAYLCATCLRNNKTYKNHKRDNPLFKSAKWSKQCSENSKALWENEGYKNKMRKAAEMRKSDEWSSKISAAMKDKFNSDLEYVEKVTKARQNYPARKTMGEAEFIEKAKEIHKNKYDYSLVQLDGPAKHAKVKIVCPTHGTFTQRPLWHLSYKNGCPQCAANQTISTAQSDIAEFIKNNTSYTDVEMCDRSMLGFEIDIYVARAKFAIEYHGSWFHSHNEGNHLSKYLHHLKASKAEEANLKLLQIFEHDWQDPRKQKIFKSSILHNLGASKNKIYARQCIIKQPSVEECNEFFGRNHLYGKKHYTVAYGLYCNETCYSIVSFYNRGNGVWEIVRLANKLGASIVGGCSKIFKHFVRHHDPNKVISYCDRMFSNGSVYEVLGFYRKATTKPGYKYFKNNKVFSRHRFQKHKLKKLLQNFDGSLTEMQNMFNNGYRVIWDAGHYRYEWSQNES